MDDIVLFNECSIDDVAVIGKKAAFLSELSSKGFNVAPGFIITGNLFVKFVEMVNIKENIAEILMSHMDKEKKSLQIQQIILNTKFPEDMAEFIYQSYMKLGDNNEPFVALKVSSTSDFVEDAFYLNIQGKDRLINGIKSCWASVFSFENIDLKRFKPSIIVHKMVNPIKSGYVYSRNPQNGNPNQILIQCCSGLGNAISLSQVVPTAYVIDKENLNVVNSFFKEQTIQYSLSMENRRTEKIELTEPVKNVLDDFIIKELGKLVLRAESRINDPQRISFAVDKNIAITSSKSINLKEFKDKFSREYEVAKDLNTVESSSNESFNSNNEISNSNNDNFGLQNSEQNDEYEGNYDNHNQNPENHNDNQQDMQAMNDNTNDNYEDESLLSHYEPEVHHNSSDNENDFNKNNFNNTERNEHSTSDYDQSQSSQHIQYSITNEENNGLNANNNENKNYDSSLQNSRFHENSKVLLGKSIFLSGFSVVSCDMTINSSLRKKYRDLYFKEPPSNYEVLLNDLKHRVNIPYEEEILRIRKIRDNFLNSLREPEAREIHFTLDYAKKFVDEF